MSVDLLSRDTVLRVTGLPRSTLSWYVREGKFPPPVPLPGRVRVWRSDVIAAWLKANPERIRAA